MDPVRIGIVGCGNMARHHVAAMTQMPELHYCAVADTRAQVVDQQCREHGVEGFASGQALIDSGRVEAVLIATPHAEHAPLSRYALGQGVHVLTEKPVAVTAHAAEQTNDVYAAARRAHPGLRFAAMFQYRVAPVWRAVKQLIEDGRLGPLLRVDMTITNWFRTQAYYDADPWRGTWAGEGGGVLLNQCPHNLDLLQWLAGMPCRVTATVGLGKHHEIEVEDEVVALLHYESGAAGSFVTSTGEAPGFDRLTLVGDRATVVVEDKTATLLENNQPISQFRREAPDTIAFPHLDRSTIEPEGEDRAHRGILENFVAAVRDPEVPLVSPGVEGIRSLELGNAMLMSGITGEPVDVPMDREAYERLLEKLAGN